MVDGVSKGYEKKMEIYGTGYSAKNRAASSCRSAMPTRWKYRSRRG
jgi:ribosomal protein L6P/L9E